MTTTETTTPRVWAACLACYNDGRLTGAWLDATDPDDLWEGIAEMMKGPKHGPPRELAIYGPHEEHAFHDFEGFGAYRVSEYETVESVCAVGAAIEEHGEAVALWLANDSTNAETLREDADAFGEHYLGAWESAEEWADAEWEGFGHERDLDRWKADTFGGDSTMARCVDFDAAKYVHECECEGSIWTETGSDYRVHVFAS